MRISRNGRYVPAALALASVACGASGGETAAPATAASAATAIASTTAGATAATTTDEPASAHLPVTGAPPRPAAPCPVGADFDHLKDRFDAEVGSIRVLALLSPT